LRAEGREKEKKGTRDQMGKPRRAIREEEGGSPTRFKLVGGVKGRNGCSFPMSLRGGKKKKRQNAVLDNGMEVGRGKRGKNSLMEISNGRNLLLTREKKVTDPGPLASGKGRGETEETPMTRKEERVPSSIQKSQIKQNTVSQKKGRAEGVISSNFVEEGKKNATR